MDVHHTFAAAEADKASSCQKIIVLRFVTELN